MTTNTLTGLIPVIYDGLDIVSRELAGFIPAVNINASAQQAAKDQTIRIPITPANSAVGNISPGIYAPDDGQQTIAYADMTISKSRYAPVMWSGEELQGFFSNGTYKDTLIKQFTQGMRALVNEVETDLGALAIYSSRAYGTAGSTPFASSLADAAQVRKILDDNGVPQGDRSLVINTTAGVNLRSLTHLTQAYAAGTDETLRQGTLLNLFGIDIKESAQILAHTAGTNGAGYAVDHSGGYAIGDTSILLKTGTGTVLAGDYVTFAGDAHKYIVKTGVTAAGQSIVIEAPGLMQTLADSVAMTCGTTNYTANCAFHKDAIQLIARAPIMPMNTMGKPGDMATDVLEITDPLTGITFQLAEYAQYRRVKYEVGLAWGVAMIKPAHACVLLG